MKVLVILAHPREGSFNHAIAKTVIHVLNKNKHRVVYHDLYKEKFNPVLSYDEIATASSRDSVIIKHCHELSTAEGIIIIHPNWWGQPPAILKGWVDRVMRAGVAYEFAEGDKGEGEPAGLLKAKIAIVFNTSDTAKTREDKVFTDPLEAIWKKCIFGLCAVAEFHRKTYGIVVTSTKEKRITWLKDARKTVNRYFPK